MRTADSGLFRICLLFALLLSGVLIGCGSHASIAPKLRRATAVDVADLLEWPAYGQGTVQDFRGEAVIMTEAEESEGMVLVSPQRCGRRVVLRYKAFALTPGSVLVVILSASDGAETDRLTLPAGYDGAIGPWVGPKPNYFFAFHNAAHMRHPFVNRFGGGEGRMLAEADGPAMRVGRWHDVEVGRWDDRLWFKIDGRMVLRARDGRPLGDGHVALRIRGTGPHAASVMLREVRLLEPNEEAGS